MKHCIYQNQFTTIDQGNKTVVLTYDVIRNNGRECEYLSALKTITYLTLMFAKDETVIV